MLSCNKLPNALFLLTGLPLLWLSIPHSFVVPAGQHIAKQQTHLLDSQHGKMGCGGHCLFIDNNDFKSKAVLTPEFNKKPSSIDSKCKEICKHFTWRPTDGGEELNIIFSSEISKVSITLSSSLHCLLCSC